MTYMEVMHCEFPMVAIWQAPIARETSPWPVARGLLPVAGSGAQITTSRPIHLDSTRTHETSALL
jgi:hypothetical protein